MDVLAANDEQIELAAIPSGEFQMGSDNQFFSESPAHLVKIRNRFLLGKYPVTQAQWSTVMGYNPSSFRASLNHPVDTVSWDQAMEFCRRLSDQSARRVRLPSEAEWEYSCRAGSTSDFFFGSWDPFLDDSEIPSEARQALSEYAWFDLNSGECTQPVGLKRPNSWGLHDLLGNVWEWCWDTWHGDYMGAPEDARPWIEGEERQPRRCQRGGAWDMNAFRCRSSYRSYDHREMATSRCGFRLAVDDV
jgi:formylglycine-generating enzyme required for sulfatase activity